MIFSRKSMMIAAGLFLFVCAYFFVIQFSTPSFVGQDDAYYHLAHSFAYYFGTDFHFPAYSTFSTHAADPYVGYHLLLSFLAPLSEASNYDRLLFIVKIVNIVLAALCFVLLYLIVTDCAVRFAGNAAHRTWHVGMAAVLFLLAAIPAFTFRLAMARPHLISVLLFLSLLWCLLKRQKIGIFIVSLAYPFFYSISFIALIPTFLYSLSRLIASREYLTLKHWTEFALSALGLAVGLLLRPDTLNYIYNAYFLPMLSIWFRFTGQIGVAKELYSNFSAIDFLWIIPLLAAFLLWLSLYKNAEKEKRADLLFICMMAVIPAIAYLFVGRAVEYVAPLIAIFVVMIFYLALRFSPATANPAVKFIHWALGVFKQHPRIHAAAISGYVLLLLCAGLFGILKWTTTQPPFDEYRAAAEFIRSDSDGEGIVFITHFEDYSRLVFFNPSNRYSAGMDNVYPYVYSKDLFLKSRAIRSGQHEDPYTVIAKDFSARYVFLNVDREMGRGGGEAMPLLERDARFRKVFTDAKYPHIVVYKVGA